MTNTKTIPIIIVTYNQLHNFTIPCIDSILNNTHDLCYHIIIVDNNSSDNTVEVLEDKYNSDIVTVLSTGDNLGWDGGNLKGIDYIDANFDYDMFVLLNSDTLVSFNWLNRMVNILRKHKNAVSIIPVEEIRKYNIIKSFFVAISEFKIIRFIISNTFLNKFKGKGITLHKQIKPPLEFDGIAHLDGITKINKSLTRKHGDTSEILSNIGTGYCVLIKKQFKTHMINFLYNFDKLWPKSDYWVLLRKKYKFEYLRAKGVYVYHFRGGSGGYFYK